MPIKILQIPIVVFCLIGAFIFCNSPTSPQVKYPSEFLGSWIDIDTSSTIISDDSLTFYYNSNHPYCVHSIYNHCTNDSTPDAERVPNILTWWTINDSLFLSGTSYQFTLYPDSLLMLKKDTTNKTYHKVK